MGRSRTHLELRTPSTAAHREAIERARCAIRALRVYPRIDAIAGPERAEADVRAQRTALSAHLQDEV